MPIPSEILRELQFVQICAQDVVFTVRQGREQPIPAELAPCAWGIAPGLFAESETAADLAYEDLLKRIKQAGISFKPARFVGQGREVPGCLLLGVSRDRSIRLAYKLGEWALFHLEDSQVRIVYTGYNSRSR
jgi:hypothetical protein